MSWQKLKVLVNVPKDDRVHSYELGQLTAKDLEELRKETGTAAGQCPLCRSNSANFMYIEGTVSSKTLTCEAMRGPITHKCICVITRPPHDGNYDTKKRQLDMHGLADIPADFVRELGLDFGWGGETKLKRVSFLD